MPKNKLSDLRNHLFETLEKLADEDKPMEIERAKAVADVAQTIINSAKLELQFFEMTGQESRSDFLGPAEPRRALLPMNGKKSA